MTRVVWCLDDILVNGEIEEEHLKILEDVLAQLQNQQMFIISRLSRILGSLIDKDGIKRKSFSNYQCLNTYHSTTSGIFHRNDQLLWKVYSQYLQ